MNLKLLASVLLLVFGGGGFLLGGTVVGLGEVGIVLLVCLTFYAIDSYYIKA